MTEEKEKALPSGWEVARRIAVALDGIGWNVQATVFQDSDLEKTIQRIEGLIEQTEEAAIRKAVDRVCWLFEISTGFDFGLRSTLTTKEVLAELEASFRTIGIGWDRARRLALLDPLQVSEDAGKTTAARIVYTNHRNETRERNIIPFGIYFGQTKYHPMWQWLLTARDLDKQAERTFALASIKEWKWNHPPAGMPDPTGARDDDPVADPFGASNPFGLYAQRSKP